MRTSREEIPRFRFNFKHVSTEQGNKVHEYLVDCFIEDYLEGDGYFFIRLLTVNVSDYIVQEIIEQLWSTYIYKYGENDAKNGEKAYLEFRDTPEVLTPRDVICRNPLANSNSGRPDDNEGQRERLV